MSLSVSGFRGPILAQSKSLYSFKGRFRLHGESSITEAPETICDSGGRRECGGRFNVDLERH